MTRIPRKEDTVLVADDEAYNLQFLLDFLETLNYKVEVAVNVDDALHRLQQARYRVVLADLSIPLLPPQSLLIERDALYQKYPGLLIADYARNHNHTGRQVVVYSVHEDPQVRDFANRFGVAYLLKGRPRILKDEIRDILAYDPLAKPKS
jgi:CheY-like chemotaxis protein